MMREDRIQGSELSRERSSRHGPWEITTNVITDNATNQNPPPLGRPSAQDVLDEYQRTVDLTNRHNRHRQLMRQHEAEYEANNDLRLRASIDAVIEGPVTSAPVLGLYSRQRRRLDDTEAALRSLRESREDIARLQALLTDPPRSSSVESLRATLSQNNSSQTQNLNMLTTPSDSGTTSRVASPQLPTGHSGAASPPRSSMPSQPPSRPASILAELPPLSRVSAHPNVSRLAHPSFEQFRQYRIRRAQNRFDGLGDRERSVSSEGDGIWEPLVSTMTPDPQSASASSSFASASAAASISSRSNAGTSSTSMTTVGDSEAAINPDACESEHSGEDHCEENNAEEDDADVEEEEDEDEAYIRALLQPEEDRYISYAQVISHPQVHRLQTRVSNSDFETVDRWQPIIRALSRREDIPDEWWAEAGLARILQEETIA